MRQDRVCTVFYAVSKLCEVLKEAPIKDKVWEHKIDDHWFIKINGHSKEMQGIPAFHMTIEYDGFPAGILSPFEGTIAAGTEANEDTFIEAVEKKLAGLGVSMDELFEEDRRTAQRSPIFNQEKSPYSAVSLKGTTEEEC